MDLLIALSNNSKPFLKLNNRLAEIGFLVGDVIRVFNGTDISQISKENMDMVNNLFNMSFSWTPEQEVSFEVDRKGKRVVLNGKVGVAFAEAKGIVAKQNAKPAQIALRNAWLHGN